MTEQQVKEMIISTLDAAGQEWHETDRIQWDSLIHVELLVTLDTAFDGRLADIADFQDAYSVQGILSILRSHNLLDEG